MGRYAPLPAPTRPLNPFPERPIASITAWSATPSAMRTVSSTACLSKSTFLMPWTFFSSALIASAQLAQSAPWIE